ncbi:MAG: aminotransferase class I/II-fold pyridoxal phosphate-dependent enzyme [Desulfobacteraceae bacterium]|nr:aminotransferase class I/II-fold pyridoxal phosphate-dependent enzyme [Desulfobacteraceae bacterium]
MYNTFISMKERIPDITVSEDRSLHEVYKKIDKGALGFALLEEPQTHFFKGVVTDGDLRRALLKGVNLDLPAYMVIRPKTVTAYDDTPVNKIAKMFRKSVRFIPILDQNNRVVDVKVLDSRLFIPVASPIFSGNELKYVSDCVMTGWVSSAGKYVTEFEQIFADFCNTKFAVSVNSGTAALHLALLSIGVGPGDEVIVPSLTFISTANAVKFTGATPVFVDCDIKTWNIKLAAVEKAITKKTKAIIPVHLYGHPVDMDPIINLAKENEISIIEDAAEAHGALYKGKKTGSLGELGIFSFYGNKPITTGEGGMVVTDDKKLADKIRLLRDHGMDPAKRYIHSVLGYNYRMTNIQAALGVAQMEYIDQIIEQKRLNALLYSDGLKGVPGIALPPQADWAKSIYWLYSIIIDEDEFGMSATKLAEELKKVDVDTRPLFPPIHKQPIYDTKQFLPVSEMIADNGLSLPSSVGLCKSEINNICEAIRSIAR